MNEVNNRELLTQMKIMAAQARSETQDVLQALESKVSFRDTFKEAVDAVDDLQGKSADMKKRFALNDPTVSLADTMVAMQKASIAFEASLQVRNKLLQAYQDIMNMPI